MAKKRTTRTVYRDTKTGQFVSKQSWNRSRSHGGTRFKRIYVQLRQKKPVRPTPVRPIQPPSRPPSVFEWIVSFSYNRSGRSFDVIVTAETDQEARAVAKEFLRTDIDGSRIARGGFKGWSATVAKGKPTELTSGEAEYRSKSRAKRKKRKD